MIRNWVPLWVLPVLALSAIGTVWLRLAIVRTSYSIDQADRTIRELRQSKEQAELKMTALRSPRRLEVLAKTRFGLSQPNASQMIHTSTLKPHAPNPTKTLPSH